VRRADFSYTACGPYQARTWVRDMEMKIARNSA
jgi:hypothetical protein